MTPVRFVSAAAIAVLVAACGGTGSAGGTPGPSVSSGETVVEVTLTDALRIEPAAMTVPAGRPVRFVVTNAGATDHEFYLGDEAAQEAHAREMAEMGGMAHDEPEGIGVRPGETKELVYTFAQPGDYLAGCHVAGHYAAGMKATIRVTE
ncbi:MAG TPA: cupredoxin domain-containing protein [Candidatus Limnocylindrales bacterium]|nr:cupredoxin domain-containing protein [Candidatus Limnocylindrales bacterium]